MKPPFAILLALLAPAPLVAADADVPMPEVRAAVEKALPLIQKGAAGHMAHRTCFACHHQAIPLLAMTTARSRGLPVDEAEVGRHAKFIAAFLAKNRENYLQGRGQGGQADTAGYALLALALAGHAPDATTDAVAEYLLLRDKDVDHWRNTSNRPPSEASPFTTTAVAVRGLRRYGTAAQKERIDRRLAAVRPWLVKATPKDTEDRVFRLWAMKDAGCAAKEIDAAARQLLKTQRDDGGWAQRDGMTSDAYATGTALVALHQAAGLATDDPAYRRGLRHLLKTQHDDGSWHVASRSKPFQLYFESGFPHGKDQFISLAASGWAATALALALPPAAGVAGGVKDAPALPEPMRTLDLNRGETQNVVLADGTKVTVKLLDLKETRDPLRDAVRRAEVTVAIDGQPVTLVSANYRLPQTVGKVRVDCPVTRGYRESPTGAKAGNPWALDKDARIRVWPAGGPLLDLRTFVYPARQRWFASATQMANEPVYVDGGERPLVKSIYYHYGLDIGGAEALVDVVAATDGLVVSAGKQRLPGFENSPAKPRYDVVYVRDGRGWYYRYSHLHTIHPTIRPGAKVTMGQRIGLLGKEGGSGGWSHLHFDITGKQPSGRWGIIDGYAFLWAAYQKQYAPKLQAVARPHHFIAAGETIEHDATRSWAAGKIKTWEWTFTDGTHATGPRPTRTYAKPGTYSEVVKITDDAGRVDYDFAIVQVVNRDRPKELPPSIHATYAPTFGIKPGEPVTFLVRTFRTTDGKETWDFGDGSPKVDVMSDGNVVPLAKDGYARTVHRFERPGHYLVRVERTNRRGETAVAHLHVRVGVE
jgi:murein DD-endopeptidase MepM/ murein hydrolase activator NlpD